MTGIATSTSSIDTSRRSTSSIARRPKPRIRFRWSQLLFFAPAALYLVLIFAYPVSFSFWLSFQKFDLGSLISGISEFVGLQNYVQALQSPDFGQALENTLVFTVVSITAQFVIGLALALFFTKKFPGSRVIRAALVLPWLVPGILATTAWRWLFAPHGLINQALGLVGIPAVPWLTSPTAALPAVIIVNIWVGISFNMVLLHGGIQAIPSERFEAAQLDGANAFQRLLYVTLPALRPVASVILTLGFVYTLKQFDIIFTLTGGGPGNASQLLSTWSYTLSFTNNSFGAGAAVSGFLFMISIGAIVLYSIRNRRDR